MKNLVYLLTVLMLLVSCKKESPDEETMLSYADMNIDFMPKKCASSDGCKQHFYFTASNPGQLFSSDWGGVLVRMYYYKTGKSTATMLIINSSAGVKYEYSLTFKGKTFGNYECKYNNSFYASGRFRIYQMHKI